LQDRWIARASGRNFVALDVMFCCPNGVFPPFPSPVLFRGLLIVSLGRPTTATLNPDQSPHTSFWTCPNPSHCSCCGRGRLKFPRKWQALLFWFWLGFAFPLLFPRFATNKEEFFGLAFFLLFLSFLSGFYLHSIGG